MFAPAFPDWYYYKEIEIKLIDPVIYERIPESCNPITEIKLDGSETKSNETNIINKIQEYEWGDGKK